MQNQYRVADNVVALTKADFAVRQTLGAFAILMFSMAFVPYLAIAAPEHKHVMDHSEHEHHMQGKPGILSSSVATYAVQDVKLVDMNGVDVALHNVLSSNSPVILNFIFTSCTTICPVMSGTFQQVQQQLGPKRSHARMVSISIDPENDTPARLKEYASKYGVGSQWKLLTGTYENSISVQRAFGIYAGDKMNHKPVTFLKAQGSENTWVRLDGLATAPEIIREFDKLKPK